MMMVDVGDDIIKPLRTNWRVIVSIAIIMVVVIVMIRRPATVSAPQVAVSASGYPEFAHQQLAQALSEAQDIRFAEQADFLRQESDTMRWALDDIIQRVDAVLTHIPVLTPFSGNRSPAAGASVWGYTNIGGKWVNNVTGRIVHGRPRPSIDPAGGTPTPQALAVINRYIRS